MVLENRELGVKIVRNLTPFLDFSAIFLTFAPEKVKEQR
jgi:hypothetical protein